MASPLNSQFAIDVVINNIAELKTLRTAVDGMISLRDQTVVIKLDLDTAGFDTKLAAARKRAGTQPVTSQPSTSSNVTPTSPTAETNKQERNFGNLKALFTKLDTNLTKFNVTIDALTKVVANLAGRQIDDSTEGNAAYKRKFSSRRLVSRFEDKDDLTYIKKNNPQAIINTIVRDFELAAREQVRRITRGIDRITPTTSVGGLSAGQIAAAQQRDIPSAERENTARANRLKLFDRQRELAIASAQAEAINVEKEANNQKKRNENRLRLFDRQRELAIGAAQTEAIGIEKDSNNQKKKNSDRLNFIARKRAEAIEFQAAEATRINNEINKSYEREYKRVIASITKQATTSAAAGVPVPTSAGFAGGTVAEKTAAFNIKLRQTLTALDAAVSGFQNRYARVQGATSAPERESAQSALNNARQNVGARSRQVSYLVGQAANQGLPVPKDLLDLTNKLNAATAERIRQETALLRLFIAEQLAAKTSIGPQKQAAAGREATSIKAGLAAQGVSAQALGDIEKTEQRLLQSVLQRSNAYVQQNGVIKQQQDGLDKFVARFQQLARFAFAGGILFGIIGVVKNSVSEVVKLEAELTRIQGILGRTNINDRLKIEQSVLDQARTFGINLGQIVNTVKDFAQAGFTLKQSLALSESVAKATVGGGLETGQATQTAIAAENISRGRVTASDIFGRIAKIERTNAVTGQDLAVVIQRVGALANQFQERQVGAADSFDTLIGLATTIIENTRITGNQAATGLRFLLSRLTSPQVSNKLQQQFGIRLASNAEGTTLRPLPDILSDIAATFKSLKAQGRTVESTSLLTTLSGGRQAFQAAALLDNFGKAVDTARESAFAFGDVERRTAAQLQTLQSRFGQLTNATIAYANVLLEKTGLLAGLKYGTTKLTQGLEFGAQSPGTALLASLTTYLGFKSLGGLGRGGAALTSGSNAAAALAANGSVTVASASKFGQLFSRVGAAIGIGGGVEAAVVGASKGSLLLRGLGLLGSVVAKFSGYLTIGLILYQIGSFISKMTGFGKGLEDAAIRIPTYKDIATQFDFGKEFTETSRGYSNSNLGFTKIIAQIVDNANKSVLNSLKKFNPAVLTGGATDRRYRSAFEKAAVEQANLLLPGFGNIPKEEQTQAILGYITQSAKFAGGPTQAATVSVEKDIEEKIGKLTDVFNDPKLIDALRRKITLDQRTTIGNITRVSSGDQSAARDVIKQLEQDFPRALSNLSLSIAGVTKNFTLLDAINREISNGAATTGQALDLVFREFFSFFGKSAGGQKIVQQNIKNLDENLRRTVGTDAIRKQLGLEVQDAAVPVAEEGGKFFTFLREQLIKVTRQELAKIKGTDNPIAIALKEVLRLAGDPGNGGAFTANIPKAIIAQRIVRDRVVDLLANFARQQEEIQGTRTAFGQAGLPFDVRRERQSSIEGLVRGLAGVTAQIHSDLIRARLRLSGQNFTRSSLTGQGDAADLGDDGSPRLTHDDIARQRLYTRAAVGALTEEEFKSLNDQAEQLQIAYDNITHDRAILGKLNGEDRAFLTKYLAIDTSTAEGRKQRLESLLDFETVAGRLLKIAVTENTLFERGNLQLQQRYELTQAIADLEAQAAQAQLERVARRGDAITQFGGIGARTQSIQLEREIARQRAQAGFDVKKELLDSNANAQGYLGSDRYLNELLPLQANLSKELQSADLLARNRQIDLQENTRLQLFEQITANVRGAVENASSGLLSVISSFESLTSGQLFQRVIDPIANEITGGFAKNFRDALVGDNGLFQKAAENLVGGPARLAGKAAEARLEAQILNTSLITTAQQMGAILSQSLYGTSNASGPTSVPTSVVGNITGTLGNNVPGLAGVAAATPLAAILLGGRAANGPNAFNSRGNLTQGAGGSSVDGFYGNIPGASAFYGLAGIGNGIKGTTFKERFKNLKDAALPLIGAYGGAALGGIVGGRGVKGSYASEGGALGSGIGSLAGGPVGGLIGGLLGGLLGGILGKDTPRPTPELSILEKIERGQRAQIQVIENQTRQLLSIDNRVLNAPASLAITGYRPFNSGAGTGQIVGAPQVYINVDARGSTQPNKIIDSVSAGVSKGLRNVGTYVPKY